MGSPDISVVIPVRNESEQLEPTLASIAESRSGHYEIELVVVDDASTDGCCQGLHVPGDDVSLVVNRQDERVGIPQARNRGGETATGTILFMTDAHVRLSEGWDWHLHEMVDDDTMVAASIMDPDSSFVGHGCELVVPFMGTHWNRQETAVGEPVQVASCAGTGVSRDRFASLGGYDPKMRVYGGAEPEFSVRAWLSGADIVANPDIRVSHRFKSQQQKNDFLEGKRSFMIHNNLRFGLLYLNELTCLQMVRHFTQLYPDHVQDAFDMVTGSDVWERRSWLHERLQYDFGWFVEKFDLTDQADRQIVGYAPDVLEAGGNPST